MSNIVFNRIIICSPLEQLAKVIELAPGLNVVTSQQKDGSDLGKSIIAKSFYHCLGADCKFDGMFAVDSKVFILSFEFDGTSYTMYRSKAMFKLFDSNYDILWSTSNRQELGKLLYVQFGFAIWLPSRTSQETEIAPPAYSYAPYFVDQNHYNGSNFSSFMNMGQYKDYKLDLIFTFAGAYDEMYFDNSARKKSLEDKAETINAKLEANKSMSHRILDELVSLGYSANMGALAVDCDEHEADYKILSSSLSKIRNDLYRLREKRVQTKSALEGAEALGRRLDRGIRHFDGSACPLCHNRINNPIETRVAACVTHTDVLILGDELGQELQKLNKQITEAEVSYKQELNKLDKLKRSMDSLRQSNATAIQAEGLNRLAETLAGEREGLEESLDNCNDSLKDVSKILTGYADVRKDVNERFVELITAYVKKLNLRSIDLEKIKGVKNVIAASGSNAPVATVAWYFTLLRLKDEFNPERVCLPLILDSPMNVEADEEKTLQQYALIFENFRYANQMLVTGLGLYRSEVVPDDANVITLTNEKYKLLNEDDFEAFKDVVFTCMEQH